MPNLNRRLLERRDKYAQLGSTRKTKTPTRRPLKKFFKSIKNISDCEHLRKCLNDFYVWSQIIIIRLINLKFKNVYSFPRLYDTSININSVPFYQGFRSHIFFKISYLINTSILLVKSTSSILSYISHNSNGFFHIKTSITIRIISTFCS